MALDVVAQALPPHYDPISSPESDLAVGPYGLIMTVNFVNRGVLSLLFLYALWSVYEQRKESPAGTLVRPPRAGFISFGIWSLGGLLLAVFPTDVPPIPVSWHGAIHLVVAIIAFVGGAVGTVLLSLRFGQLPALARAKNVSLAIGFASLGFLFLELGSAVTSIGGLLERLFLASVLLWTTYASIRLLRELPSV
jgi:Protein of unknown function (DUF998)